MFRVATANLLLLALVGPSLADDFELHAGWHDQLFPSYIISTATVQLPDDEDEATDENRLGDPQGLLGVSVTAAEDDESVTVEITCDAIMQPSSITVVLPTAGETYSIYPTIHYHYAALARQKQSGPITVAFSVTRADEEEPTVVSRKLTLRSVNDCPYSITEGDDTRDVSVVFAAYVNEDHPFVDKLLREGLDTGIVDSFDGYQAESKEQVYRQVYALWHALSLRDVRYSSITTTAPETEGIGSQHVRMLDDSINNGQANCVDGSVLLASLLRKIGIEPVLVMVPGHCYLAFQLDEEGTEFAGLETTLIGSTVDEATKLADMGEVVDASWADENSWKTFTAAIAMGSEDLRTNAEGFKADDDPDHQLISVAAARKLGILPIAYAAKEKLKAPPQ
jgi:hypothetical protein